MRLLTRKDTSLPANHRPITKREAKYGIDENPLTVLIRNLKLVCARIRFYKRYLVARRRQAELKSIEASVRDRLGIGLVTAS